MKPNVLQLIGSFHQGGTERQVAQLVRLLHDCGRYQLHIACLNRDGVLREEIERLGFKDIPEFPLTSFYDRNFAKQLRRFASLLRDREISVLHTHDFYGNVFGMASSAVSRRSMVRIASRRETGGVRSAAQNFVQRRAFARADMVVANSEAVRRELIAKGLHADKTTTIHNGIDIARVTVPNEFQRDVALELLGLQATAGRRVVTIVANMRHTVKDLGTFLRAAGRVQTSIAGTVFVLAGEGELLDGLRKFSDELGLADSTFFIGACKRIAELLAVSEVCVLSSTHEGFSNSILEYMAAARPVVVTDVGGAREAVSDGKNGYIVPAGDDRAMAERIISLLSDPQEALRMGLSGQRVVKENFSCEAQLNNTIELYDRLLGELQLKNESRTRKAASREATVIER